MYSVAIALLLRLLLQARRFLAQLLGVWLFHAFGLFAHLLAAFLDAALQRFLLIRIRWRARQHLGRR